VKFTKNEAKLQDCSLRLAEETFAEKAGSSNTSENFEKVYNMAK
jgi:hypothetical protein